MIPGHGLRDGYLSSLALDGSPACRLFTALELERYPSRRPCLMGRGVNPTFHSQMSIPDHPLHQITWFLVFWCSYNKWTSLQKNWIESTQWLVRCAFWVISLKKNQQKGCQNGSKSHPLQTWVSTSNINYQHTRIILVVFWGLKNVWLGHVEGIRGLFMPN